MIKISPESQKTEYKSSWQEDYFSWISGYANAEGGTIFIGVNDDGYVVGVKDTRFLLDTLPNQISSFLGITVSIDHGYVNGVGHNLKYQSVPDDVSQKPENLYARGILTEQALNDIDADPGNTADVTDDVQALFDAAPGFVKQLRQSQENRDRIRIKLSTWKKENPVFINSDGTVEYVWITVPVYSHGVPYHGRYYIRSGGTTKELKGAALSRFLYDKVGINWDAAPVKDITLDHSALDFLREHALQKNRLTQKAVTVSDETLIKNLQILTKDGEYTRAAAMLFGNPEDVVFGAYIRIGFFDHGKLKYQDEIHGPLISQAHIATDMIFNKYLKALVDIKGLQRTETYMTTEELLREVILNAVAHKYYPSNVPVQIRVSDDHIVVMNEGFWPFDNLAVEDVYTKEHSSYPANPLIGNGLFFAGAMDTWGQGFLLIKDECEKINAPLPEIEATEKYVTVTIHGCEKYMQLLNKSTSTDSPIRQSADSADIVSDRQKQILEAMEVGCEYKSDEIGVLVGLKPSRSRQLLKELVDKGLIESIGSTNGKRYIRKA